MAENIQKKENSLIDDEYEVTLDEALSLAEGHHGVGNYVLAERTYRDILRAVPDHFPTVMFLGVLLYQTGNIPEALIHIEKAIEVEPEKADCWTNYSAVLVADAQFDKALEALDKAIELKPEAPSAYNNKSYVYTALNRFEEAEDAARKALELQPDNVDTLINLGIALARQERKEEALEIWEQADALAPDNARILANWGNTLRDMNRIVESEEKCARALEINPDHMDAANNLANAYRDQGRVEEAIELYIKVTDKVPDFHSAHYNLSLAYIDQKRFDRAAVAARYAVAFEKERYEYYSALSQALRECGDFMQAYQAAHRAVFLAPDEAEPYLDMADSLLALDRYDDGLAVMQEALKQEHESPRVYMKLCDVYEKLNELDKSIEALDKAAELAPDMALIYARRANIMMHASRSEEAFEAIDRALEIADNWPMALVIKAELYISVNENDKAAEIIELVKTLTNKNPGIYGVITSLKKMDELDEDFIMMKEVYDDICEYGIQAATAMNFSMFKAYENIKDYDKAFEYLKEANDSKRKEVSFNPDNAHSKVSKLKAQNAPHILKSRAGKGYEESDLAVFIVGMPRSGTTLTEQIISSHPLVYGAGELSELGKAMRKNGFLDDDNAHDIGEEYIKSIRALCPDEKIIRITDKMPGNYQNIGVIASTLPNAKIIHCRRNPVDTCLSCYKQNFAVGQYWSYDLEELADEYLRYLEIMEYWRETLPEKFIEIDYEETVTNTEVQARKLIDYIGLEWDEACLEPHKQKRVVLTASKAQVTKPVYTSSVQGWKRYEKQLQPLVRKLLPEEALDA